MVLELMISCLRAFIPRLPKAKGTSPPKQLGFFFWRADRTDRVSNAPTPAAIKKRVQVRHEVYDPVQIRKNPATGRIPKLRVYGSNP